MANRSTRLVLKNVRCIYPKLFTPEEYQGKSRYGITLLLPKDSEQLEQVGGAIKRLLTDVYGSDAARKLQSFKGSKQSWPLKALDDGGFTLNPKRHADKGAPIVLDQAKRKLEPTDGRPYGGCWVNVSLDVYAFDKAGAQGVTTYLNGVQLVREDEPLAGAGSAASCADDFESLENTGGSQEDDIPW